jgi:hypothetical protein
VSSTHILFPPDEQAQQLAEAGYLLRSGVQFHWDERGLRVLRRVPGDAGTEEAQEHPRRAAQGGEAGVTMRRVRGIDATDDDWRFFTAATATPMPSTISTPYLNLDFFRRIGRDMPHNLLLVIAERDGAPIAASLVVHDDDHAVRPLLGRAGTRALPAFRDRLLPAAGVLHRTGHPGVRGRRPGRAQDGARLPADPDLVGALAGASRRLPTRWSASWNAKAAGSTTISMS